MLQTGETNWCGSMLSQDCLRKFFHSYRERATLNGGDILSAFLANLEIYLALSRMCIKSALSIARLLDEEIDPFRLAFADLRVAGLQGTISCMYVPSWIHLLYPRWVHTIGLMSSIKPQISFLLEQKYRAGLKSGTYVAWNFWFSLPGCCLIKQIHYLAHLCKLIGRRTGRQFSCTCLYVGEETLLFYGLPVNMMEFIPLSPYPLTYLVISKLLKMFMRFGKYLKSLNSE